MIPLPTSIKTKKTGDNSAVFEIESLYPGYGVTIGNAIRRVLLSSLEGAAVTEAKIKGASHEFSALAGIKEDILHLMMNLKQLRFKVYSDGPETATLKVKGEKEVLAKDFEVSPQMKLANPDLHIATITDKGTELEIEIKVEKGIGYRFEDEEKEKKGIGVMGLDAAFTPIKRVNYTVENMRVGQRTDFDKIVLEVETDGTIAPDAALSQALNILDSHFKFLYGEVKVKEEKEEVKEEKSKKKAVSKKKK